MRLQGWIIHFQPNFLPNWLSWSFSECELLWQLGYLTLFFWFLSEKPCVQIEWSLSSVLGLGTVSQTPNWVSLTVWILVLNVLPSSVFFFFFLKKKYCSINVNCYLCPYASSQLFACISFMNAVLLTRTLQCAWSRENKCEQEVDNRNREKTDSWLHRLKTCSSRYSQGRRAGCCVYDSPLELKSAVMRPDIPFPLEFTKIGSVMVNHDEPKIALVTIHLNLTDIFFKGVWCYFLKYRN